MSIESQKEIIRENIHNYCAGRNCGAWRSCDLCRYNWYENHLAAALEKIEQLEKKGKGE